MKNYRFLLLTAAVAFSLASCGDKKTGEVKSFDANYLDTTVKPQDDFYQFANGSWIKNNPVPASESRYGSFNEVSDRNNELIKGLLEEAAKKTDHPKGSTMQMVGDYYACIMDSTKRESAGLAPIQSDLDQVNQLTKENLADLVSTHHQTGIGSLFSISVQEDLKDNTKYAVYLGQTGLGLPDKEYYFKTDAKSVETREKYVAFLDQFFATAGLPNTGVGQRLLAIETKLASKSMNSVEQRNIDAQYNKFTYEDFKKLCPNFDWDTYFTKIGMPKQDTILVSQPEYLKNLNSQLQAVSMDDWKLYFTAEVLQASADKLTDALEKTHWDFYSMYLRGAKEQKPRWKRAIEDMNGAMGEVLGKAFVEKSFSEDAKKRVNEMVDNLQAALKERLAKLDWMSDSTKTKAMEKMASFGRKMAYPDKWKDLSKLAVSRDSYVKNARNAAQFYFNENIQKLGKPIDKSEWLMGAHIVNAYYNPVQNEICFPAGILQPPFFDPNAEDAVNYARMGAVIGHEMIHGFDDQGAQFDAKGLFQMWWTPEDYKKFQEKTNKLVEQYNTFMPIKGDTSVKVNGQLTLGENIADFGGLTVAYYAYQKALEGKKKENLNGYTPEQRFFISFAQIWKNSATDEYLRQQVATDPHSPAKFRVNGTLSNMPEFFEAFQIPEGSPMRQSGEKIAKIW